MTLGADDLPARMVKTRILLASRAQRRSRGRAASVDTPEADDAITEVLELGQLEVRSSKTSCVAANQSRIRTWPV